MTTKWFSYSLVKHERCCHFSMEGNRTRLSLWRHALFWMGAFGRRSLTRNSSVFRMRLKDLHLVLIFWKVLAVSKWFKDIFANLYIFYLKIKKSCRCKNLDIFSFKGWFLKITISEKPFMALYTNGHIS